MNVQTETTTIQPTESCGWRCGDKTPGHKHYAVLCRELNGKLIGRLCPDGTTTTRNIYAAIISKATAERVAQEITDEGLYTARAIPF